jgi:hypothetical protein
MRRRCWTSCTIERALRVAFNHAELNEAQVAAMQESGSGPKQRFEDVCFSAAVRG